MNIRVAFGHTRQEIAAKFSEISTPLNAHLGEVQVVTKFLGEIYDGKYTVVPKAEAQTLPTANKTMQDDVTVKAIPFFEVSNNSGGNTVYIGTLDD